MTAMGTAPKVHLDGVAIDVLSEQGTIDIILGDLARGRGGWVCPVNLDVLRRVSASTRLRELVAAADLVVADGTPLVWANRLAGGLQLPERVAGSSLVPDLAAACATAGHSVFLLGGSPGAAERAAGRLLADHPRLRIAGTMCPPMGFERDPAQLSVIRETLREAAPDVVFVAFGFPKQDELALALRPLLPHAWLLSCGISLSFVAGDVTRAPRFLQVLGLEWVHRLAQEPRRLARRYLRDDPPYLLRLLVGVLRDRVQRELRRSTGEPA